MKNEITYILILTFIFGKFSFAQLDYRAELSISGGFDDFTVLPSGKIYVATKTGMTYTTEKFDLPWNIGPIKSKEDEFDGEHMDRVSFFNDSIGIISGYLHKDDHSSDYIYRTIDGGKSWNKIYLEFGKWIDAEDIDKNGNAWLASADQVIYYSKDYGKNWSIINRPENKTNQRIVTIDFLDNKEGIAGTGWDRLYYTKNNGKDWSILATPLQQKKYTAPRNQRPRIDKVAVATKQLIVSQAGKIFYTDKDSINWIEVYNAHNFDLESENDQIYLYYESGEICIHSNSIKRECQKKINYSYPVTNTVVSGGEIYNLLGNEIHVLSTSNLGIYPIYTFDYKPSKFPYFQKTDSKWWAFGQNSFYHYNESKRKYYRINENIESVSGLYPINKSKALLITDFFSTHKLFDSEKKSFERIEVSKYIKFPDLDKLRTISFEQVFYGYFHGEKNILTYSYKAGNLILSEFSSSNKKGVNKSKLRKYQLIDDSSIKDLIEKIRNPYEYHSEETLSLTTKDSLLISEYIKEVSVDSNINSEFIIYILSSEIYQDYKSHQHSFSTNWEEKIIRLGFEDNSVVKISSNNSSENNLNLSWIIDINGLKYNVTDIALWRYFNKGINPINYVEKEKKLILNLFKNFLKTKNTDHNKS